MFANWKPLALAAICHGPMAWFRNDIDPNSEIMMDTPEVARSPPLCMVDVRYAYPAGELFLLTEDAYF